MTGIIDVEDVLSKLNTVEKVSLLAGLLYLSSHMTYTLTNTPQVPTGGIPLLFLNMASLQSASLMVLTAFEAPNSSTAPKRPVSPAEQL